MQKDTNQSSTRRPLRVTCHIVRGCEKKSTMMIHDDHDDHDVMDVNGAMMRTAMPVSSLPVANVSSHESLQ